MRRAPQAEVSHGNGMALPPATDVVPEQMPGDAAGVLPADQAGGAPTSVPGGMQPG